MGSSDSHSTYTPQSPLSPETLLWAYAQGVFPMASPDGGEILWYAPDPRGVIPLEAFHAPRSLRRVIASDRFEIRTDTAFDETITACAQGQREGGWISPDLIEAYGQLFRLRIAHSVEAWRDGRLVGGLYGVHLRGAFFGESMFSLGGDGGRDSSKVSLVWLVDHLRTIGVTLLDVQFVTDHLRQFGAIEIPRDRYLQELATALEHECSWAAHRAM